MIVNPYAELNTLSFEIRRFSGVDPTTSDAYATAAIASMQAGEELAIASSAPAWRHVLRRFLMQTFLVPQLVAEAASEICISGAG